MTPGPSTRTPNPALVAIPPVTPIANSSLAELRASQSGSGGGTTTTSRKGKAKKEDDEDLTGTEIILEIAQHDVRFAHLKATGVEIDAHHARPLDIHTPPVA